MRNTFLLFALFQMALMYVGLLETSASDLDTYKTKYMAHLDEINRVHGEDAARLNQHYEKALEALLVKVRSSGDLDNTMAVTEEQKRFADALAMPSVPPALPELESLQASYAKRLSVLDAEKSQKILRLTEALDQSLEQLQRRLVKANDIEAAREVQQERRHIKESGLLKRAHRFSTVAPAGAGTDAQVVEHSIRDNIQEFMGHYYFLLPLRHPHTNAREMCAGLGGHLVSIDNEREYAFVKKLVTENDCKVWLDISDAKKEGKWENWRGMRPGYIKWKSGEPNDRGGGEDAACLGPDG